MGKSWVSNKKFKCDKCGVYVPAYYIDTNEVKGLYVQCESDGTHARPYVPDLDLPYKPSSKPWWPLKKPAKPQNGKPAKPPKKKGKKAREKQKAGASYCPKHNRPMLFHPAAVSKRTGKPYNAFWACPIFKKGKYCPESMNASEFKPKAIKDTKDKPYNPPKKFKTVVIEDTPERYHAK